MTPTRKMFTGALALGCLPLLGAGIVASSTRATTADGWFAHAYPDAATYFYAQAVAAKVTLSNAVDLTSLRFWGSSENYIFPGPNNVRGFTVRFYDSTFTTPALQFSVLRGSEITESYTGRLNADGGKEYQFTVPVSGRLASGTWYMHVGAVLIDGADGDGWMWSGGKSPGMRFTTYDANWSAWTDDAVNSVAFELSGNVACPSDLDGSRIVDFGDVALTVLDFGPCPGCNSDIDGNGFVDFGDVALQLLDTGPCP
ncbi:MAG: hypothetical protein RJA12_1177 [Planctomycetota bacterium]